MARRLARRAVWLALGLALAACGTGATVGVDIGAAPDGATVRDTGAAHDDADASPIVEDARGGPDVTAEDVAIDAVAGTGIEGPRDGATCVPVTLRVVITEASEPPPTVAWTVAHAPAGAAYAAIPDGAALVLVSATAGVFEVTAEVCTNGLGPRTCRDASTSVRFQLGHDADADGRDDACGAPPAGIGHVHVLADSADPVVTCAVRRFTVAGIAVPGAPLLYAFEVLRTPEGAEVATSADGATLTFRAATPGAYLLRARACLIDGPRPCPSAELALDVLPRFDGMGEGPDTACTLHVVATPPNPATCDPTRFQVLVGPGGPEYEWTVTEAPRDAVSWRRDDGDTFTLLTATAGVYEIEAAWDPPEAPGLPVVGRARIDVPPPAAGGTLDLACTSVVVSGPADVRTCERVALSAYTFAELVADATYEWSVLQAPVGAVYASNADGARLAFVAATEGRFTFGVRACAAGSPVCLTGSASFEVRLSHDVDHDGLDELCEGDVDDAVRFFFVLPFGDPEQSETFTLQTTVERGDVQLNVDTTGSMDQAILAVQESLRTLIIPEIATRIASVAIGVSGFRDFPCGGFGDYGDLPFVLHQRITTRAAYAQEGVGQLAAGGGSDEAESGFEALYQIATGVGRAWNCDGGSGTVMPFTPGDLVIPGLADGIRGGAGFREDSTAIVVHITDAPSHSADEPGYPGATRAETYAALEALEARVIGVVVGGSGGAYDDAREIAERTGARVPACAWGGEGERPSGCALHECCTGPGGQGEPTPGGACPLVFRVDGGSSVDVSLVAGIQALLQAQVYDVRVVLRPDEEALTRSGIDSTCFVERVIPLDATASGCAGAPQVADLDADGTLDGFRGVAPGSSVRFELAVRNDCASHRALPQVFVVYVDLLAGETRLGTKIVTVAVPSSDPKPGG